MDRWPSSSLPSIFDESFPIGNPITIIQTANICPLHAMSPSLSLARFLPSFPPPLLKQSSEIAMRGRRKEGGRDWREGEAISWAGRLARSFCGGWTRRRRRRWRRLSSEPPPSFPPSFPPSLPSSQKSTQGPPREKQS